MVHLLTEPEGGESRMGLIVSKSVGGSVVRNRVKRRVRELSRLRLGLLPQGSLLVVRALPAAGTASCQQLGADLDEALRRARAT